MEEERIGRVSKQQFDSLIQCEIQFDPVKRERAGGGGGGSKETLHKAEQKEKRRGWKAYKPRLRHFRLVSFSKVVKEGS